MRIESVTAHAFGPFADRTLELASDMTVVYGPNESGKSSWHAALYAALCGMRRGRGRAMKQDEDFADRHRPWNGDTWEVSAIVSLDDRRRVELRHDLDSKTGSAHDAALGRDSSSGIVNDGAPDGARWLGLDRRSFLSTACIRQADIQAIVNDASELQARMQRAASSAGADETAATALKAIQDFNRDNVGQDRRNSTKPLRVAKERLQTAQDNLKAAQEAHDDYVGKLGHLETLEAEASQAERTRRIVEAMVARRASDEAQGSLDRARELQAKHPCDPAPGHTQQDEMAQRANYALYSWKNRPEPVDLTGASAEEIQRQLDDLPPMPQGDTEPHPSVMAARDDYNLAHRRLKAHFADRPPGPDTVHTGGLTHEDIRHLIAELSLEDPRVDPTLQERVDRAQAKVDSFDEAEPRPSSGLFAWLFSLITAILSIFLGRRKNDASARLQAAQRLAAAKEALGEAQFEVHSISKRKKDAAAQATDRGLPSDPEALRALAIHLEGAEQAKRDLDKWRGRETELRENTGKAEEALADALRARGVTDPQPVTAALAFYENACKERDEQRREASRQQGLEREIKARENAESAADDAERRRNEAQQSLHEAADTLGFQKDDNETLATCLHKWVKEYNDAASERQRAVEEWGELRKLLGEDGFESLESFAEKTRTAAETAAQGLDEASIAATVLEPDAEAQLRELRKLESERKQALNTARGQLKEIARTVPSVAEAEEAIERARAEHERVTNLSDILSTTQRFLKRAQDDVHRDIAPHLVKALTPWIKDVTGGRYSGVMVDPQDLTVRVSGDGGGLRDATLLSHGTTEQIYLLLRVAMADLLTKDSGESCPLVLDDVTVHCDPERQTAILNLLHTLSAERQVILFSQEPETLVWARQHLKGAANRLVELDAARIPV